MGVLGPIGAETRIQMAKARRGTRPGLVGSGLDYAPPPFWSLAELLVERAAEFPDRPYIVFYDDDNGQRICLTYGQLLERVRKVAAFMRNDLQLGPGDVIAVADRHNHPDTVVVLFAAWAAGVLVAPINMREDRRRQQYILRHSTAKAVFARDRQDAGALENYLKRMTALAGDLGIPHVVQMGGDERRAAWWLDAVEEQAEPEDIDIFPMETGALLVYTAGVTGEPKGVVLTHALMYGVRAVVEANGLTAQHVFGTSLPLFHLNAIVTGVLAAAYVGGSLVLNRCFNPATFLERVEDEGITVTCVVPAMLSQICQHVRDNSIKVKRDYPDAQEQLQTVFCGAGQLYPSVVRDVEDLLGVRIRHGWGMSELACWGCQLPPDLSDKEYNHLMLDARFPAIGTPNSAIAMGVMHPETGEPLGPGEIGEIVAAGPGLMKGYYRNAVANARALQYGVLQTGDQGYYEILKRKGKEDIPVFYLTGRIKEIIERGGEKYSTLEIDADLMRIPVVEHALAYGIRHNVYGQEVGAIVQLKEGGTLDERLLWRHFMTLGYPWDKTPKVLRIVDSVINEDDEPRPRSDFDELFEGLDDAEFPRPEFWNKK